MAGRVFENESSTLSRSEQMLRSTFNSLSTIWDEMYGKQSTYYEDNCTSFNEEINTVLKDMLEQEEAKKCEFKEKFDALLVEAQQLEEELQVTVSRTPTDTEPLFTKISVLENDLKEHQQLKQERLAQMKVLKDQESELCTVLETSTEYSDVTSVPSEDLLKNMITHVNDLKREVERKKLQYTNTRNEILTLWKSLKLEPTSDYGVKVKTNELADKLGDESLNNLERFLLEVKEKQKEMQEELDAMRQTLSTLWNRLDVDGRTKDKFLSKNSQLNVETLKNFKKEIEVYTELKMKHIHKIVHAIRLELTDWWNKCHFGEEKRNEFKPFHIEEDFTEDILEEHEKEVEKVKQFYEEYKGMIGLIERRFELWDKMVDLENKANDKDRLFKNRGGQLLLEEKERKFIQKELPRIEKFLDKFFDKYENEFGSPFLYDGENVRETISEQWNGRNQLKENQKNARKNVVGNNRQAAHTKILTSQGSTLKATTPGRNVTTTLKRKIECTPIANPAKKGRLLMPSSNTPALAHTPRTRAAQKSDEGASSPASSVLSYSLFQNQLDVVNTLNSTYNTKDNTTKPVTNKPVKKSTPISKNIKSLKVPTRSKLLSPKVHTKSVLTSASKLLTKTATPRNGGNQSTAATSNLTRSRTQTRLTPHTPRQKLPFIF